MTDAELIYALQNQDTHVWKIIVERYQVQVYNVCYSFLQNAHDAEDLTQEIFIEVFRNAKKFRGDSKLSTWLHRIAVNRSLNFLRNNKKRRFWTEISNLLNGEGTSEVANESLMDSLEIKESTNQLYQAISSLPEKQRIAFTLNKLEELSYAEVAEIMEVTIASVESLIHRAKLSLQKKLSNYRDNTF